MKLPGVLLILVLFTIVRGPVAAQDDFSPPLIWSVDNDIYIADGLTSRLMAGCIPPGKIKSPLYQSPDARTFAFITEPPELTAVLEEQGGIGGGQLPNNIWLCNTVNETLRPLAVQPEDFSMFVSGTPDTYDIHSRPTWSPDGQRMAWGLLSASGENALVIFDMAAGTFQTLPFDADFPSPAGVPSALMPYWTTEGILFPMSVYIPESTQFDERIVVVSDQAQTIAQYPMSAGAESDGLVDTMLVLGTSAEGQQLAMHFYDAGWYIMDLATGTTEPMGSQPERYLMGRPDGGFLTTTATDGIAYDWYFVNPLDGYPETFTDLRETDLAISPLGADVAALTNAVEVRTAGRQYVVEGSEVGEGQMAHGLIWAPMVWRIGSADVGLQVPMNMIQCPGVQASQLFAGALGTVIDTTANNVRDQASTSAPLIGVLAPGSTFDVLEGPVCADGYAWFRVQNADVTGWTVEGDATSYWLAPVGP